MAAKNLGVIKIVHPSGMRETDKGVKVFEGAVGDVVMQEPGKKAYIVKAENIKVAQPTQRTELEVLRDEGLALGIESVEKMSKAALVKAINDKKTTPPQQLLPDEENESGDEQ